MENILSMIPQMLFGEELERALEILPEYDEEIIKKSEAERLVKLSEIYDIYIPNQISREIYGKLYLAFVRSMQKKQTRMSTQQFYENNKRVRKQSFTSIIGGADSFTIIGTSGIGKSSAISRAINLISEKPIIEMTNPYKKIIPCIVVQTPFDSSVKGLLLEILRLIDDKLNTNYYENALRARSTTDMLIGTVSNVALNHIGILVVDEIQHVVHSRHGNGLVSCLVQLINNSGISICMVGTPECEQFFSQAMQLARRSVGLRYETMKYGDEFYKFCEILFRYQYVTHKIEISEAFAYWLYEHSQGNLSVVISLLHDAQEKAIMTERERLDLDLMEEIYKERMSLLHEFIEQKERNYGFRSETKSSRYNEKITHVEQVSVVDIVDKAKSQSCDITEALKQYFIVEEIKI